MPSRRTRHGNGVEAGQREPLLLWWMPLIALLGPVVFAAWTAASANNDALKNASVALLWPGVALYVGVLVVLWAGWKIELE
jgi:hypothetical protein